MGSGGGLPLIAPNGKEAVVVLAPDPARVMFDNSSDFQGREVPVTRRIPGFFERRGEHLLCSRIALLRMRDSLWGGGQVLSQRSSHQATNGTEGLGPHSGSLKTRWPYMTWPSNQWGSQVRINLAIWDTTAWGQICVNSSYVVSDPSTRH
eukprot:1161276-Prorocentrum_minimum.AAC.1